MLKGVKCPWPAKSDDRIKMRQGRKVVSTLTPCKWFANCLKGRKRHKMRSFPKIKQSCRTVFTKQLSLVNLAVMSIIMNYLPISNGKDNCLKSRFCLSCKNDDMLLRPFWHNTVVCSGMCSQCRSCSRGVIWSYFQPLHTRLAATLSTDCRWSCRHRGIPMRFSLPWSKHDSTNEVTRERVKLADWRNDGWCVSFAELQNSWIQSATCECSWTYRCPEYAQTMNRCWQYLHRQKMDHLGWGVASDLKHTRVLPFWWHLAVSG